MKGYYKNELRVGCGTWIGQDVFFHSAGGIEIGCDVGIGPRVMILTSAHELPATPDGSTAPILHRPLAFAKVTLEDGCDIGVGAILLPGITIGKTRRSALEPSSPSQFRRAPSSLAILPKRCGCIRDWMARRKDGLCTGGSGRQHGESVSQIRA